MGKQVVPGAKRGQVFFINALEEGPGEFPFRVVIIGLDTGHKRGEHPFWDERAAGIKIDEPLVANIRTYGVREAIKVRKVKLGTGDNDYIFEVIDGRQRTKMCREAARRAKAAGEVPMPLKLEVGADREETQVGLMISLNSHRFDDTAMVRARKASDLIGMGHSRADVANMFGVSKQAIGNWLSLVTLHRSVQKAVERGELSASAAIELRDVPKGEQVEKLAELVASGTGATDAKRQRKSRQNGNAAPQPVAKRPPVKVLRRVAENEDFIDSLSPDAKSLLLWMLGDEKQAAEIPGLADVLKVGDRP